MRRHLHFRCGPDQLCGTLDMGAVCGSTGILLVSGGREIRAGTWAGQAQIAARLAANGVPVFRYDRRGIGESAGQDPGFRDTLHDITAALAAFREAAPTITRVIGFGNCDAAAALMLHAGNLDLDGLVLANPWTLVDGSEPGTPPSALRKRYLAKLTNWAEIMRLLSGEVSFAKLARGLRAAASTTPPPSLSDQLAAGLAGFAGPVAILLASGDRTAQMFEAVWPKGDPRIQRHASSGHSFAGEAAQIWLFDRLIEATR